MLDERFRSLEQEVCRRVTSVKLVQAAWQARPEVAPPPDPTTGSRSAPLEHQVCELNSLVTEVQDDLWHLQATVGGLVHLCTSPGEPAATAAWVVGPRRPVRGYHGSSGGRRTISDHYYHRRAWYSCGIHTAWLGARATPTSIATTYSPPPPLHRDEDPESHPIPQNAALLHPRADSCAEGLWPRRPDSMFLFSHGAAW